MTPSDISDLESDFDSDEDLEDSEISDMSEPEEAPRARKKAKVVTDDLEEKYEALERARKEKRADDEEEDKEHTEVGHLPIKLANGDIEQLPGKTRIAVPSGPPDKRKQKKEESDEETEYSDSEGSEDEEELLERIAGARGKFGRMGIAEVLTADMDGIPWKQRTNRRLDLAKEQIAKIGAEIMSGGELIDMVSLPNAAT
jgi:nucleolar complex protein 3